MSGNVIVGFWLVLVCPSPNVQFQLDMDMPAGTGVRSVKFTVNSNSPVVASAVNAAIPSLLKPGVGLSKVVQLLLPSVVLPRDTSSVWGPKVTLSTNTSELS